VTFSKRAGLGLALLFVVSLPAVTPRLYAADEVEYYAFLRSLWFDRDLSFDNEYRAFYDRGVARTSEFKETFLDDQEALTGRRRNFGTIGCALLWAPFYAVADVGVHLARGAGSAVAADGYSKPYLAAVTIGSAVYGFLALLLSIQACKLVLGQAGDGGQVGQVGQAGSSPAPPTPPAPAPLDLAPYGAAIAVWLGTPLLFYMYVAPGFSHACSAFAVAAFVVAWLRVRRAWTVGGMALLGALGGLMAMTREQDATFILPVALDFAWTAGSRLRQPHNDTGRPSLPRLLAGAGAAAAATAAVYLPQALAYLAVNGRLAPSHIVTRKLSWLPPYAWQVVADPEHGFLWWTPLAVVALAGLLVALRRRPRVAGFLLSMVALQVWVIGSISSWTVAGAFGQRRFVGLTVVLTVGLAVWLSARGARRARAVAMVLAGIAVWWNIALVVQFGTGTMDRKRLEPGRNAYQAFVTVPLELPRLVYRYVFDRQSFYAAPKAR